ncbi:hypothetical protein VCRA2116O29_110062 [Vibrio crassostreae]|nr:hypothetical protein VCRA2116O29_110062 [Vibrio crassostreae]CAK2440720.1 hypothetical protein VCRA2119O48_210010 [Vibrio crassostreae]CAK3566916.1 hypothetical protein VCRA2123O74_110040 [Vibrio crassostreae]CAK3842695.1 hypothetical protein VCRA212O16_220011 [Vibrio crassostreae]
MFEPIFFLITVLIIVKMLRLALSLLRNHLVRLFFTKIKSKLMYELLTFLHYWVLQ